jgi:hypothetical protein
MEDFPEIEDIEGFLVDSTADDPWVTDSGAENAYAEYGVHPGTSVSVANLANPNRLSSAQMRAFAELHEDMARKIALRVEGIAGQRCARLIEPSFQGSKKEFEWGLRPCASFSHIRLEPLSGKALIMFNGTLGALYGSGPQGDACLLEAILLALAEAWEHRILLRPGRAAIVSLEDATSFVRNGDSVVCSLFNLSVGSLEGRFGLAYPHFMLAPLLGAEASSREALLPSMEASRGAGVALRVELARGMLSQGDWDGFLTEERHEAMLPVDEGWLAQVVVESSDAAIARATVLEIDGFYGIRIEELKREPSPRRPMTGDEGGRIARLELGSLELAPEELERLRVGRVFRLSRSANGRGLLRQGDEGPIEVDFCAMDGGLVMRGVCGLAQHRGR